MKTRHFRKGRAARRCDNVCSVHCWRQRQLRWLRGIMAAMTSFRLSWKIASTEVKERFTLQRWYRQTAATLLDDTMMSLVETPLAKKRLNGWPARWLLHRTKLDFSACIAFLVDSAINLTVWGWMAPFLIGHDEWNGIVGLRSIQKGGELKLLFRWYSVCILVNYIFMFLRKGIIRNGVDYQIQGRV